MVNIKKFRFRILDTTEILDDKHMIKHIFVGHSPVEIIKLQNGHMLWGPATLPTSLISLINNYKQ